MEKGGLSVSLVLPTINEIEGMRWFMSRVKKEWYDELIVLDGGSTDGTVEFCRENGYPVFTQKGKGLGGALSEAFEHVTKDIMIEATPDGNSLPELIPALVAKMNEGYDMVIVSRYLPPAKSEDDDPVTGFGNWLFTALINLLFRAHYTDTLVGYRAFRKDAVQKMRLVDQESQTWLKGKCVNMNDWNSGSSIRAAALKLKVAEIPGDEPKRLGGVRKLNIIRNGSGILAQILHEFFLGTGFYTRRNAPAEGKKP